MDLARNHVKRPTYSLALVAALVAMSCGGGGGMDATDESDAVAPDDVVDLNDAPSDATLDGASDATDATLMDHDDVDGGTDGGADDGADGDGSAFDPQRPPTTGPADMTAWLEAGFYRSWHCQPLPNPFVMPSIHRPINRVCTNDILHNAAATDAGSEWPVGAASVKEIYDADGGTTIAGYSVQIKVRMYDQPDGGADAATADVGAADVTTGDVVAD